MVLLLRCCSCAPCHLYFSSCFYAHHSPFLSDTHAHARALTRARRTTGLGPAGAMVLRACEWGRACMLSVPLKHSLTHSHTHTHTHTQYCQAHQGATSAFTIIQALSLSLSLDLSHTHSHTHAHAHTRTHTHTAHSLTHAHAHARTHTHTPAVLPGAPGEGPHLPSRPAL